jgi:hypothetical protein
MSPPEVWGPPVWNFLHTLVEKVNENSFNNIKNSLFLIIKKICLHLPCPECSQHANYFFMKVNINKIHSKSEFKHMLYVFHNAVNKRKRKQVFNYNNMERYKYMTIPNTYNHFINVYNTKGNLNLIMESFRRSFVIKELQTWLKLNYMHFRANKTPMPTMPIMQTTHPMPSSYKIENNIIIKNGIEYEIKIDLEDDKKVDESNDTEEDDDIFNQIIITTNFNIDESNEHITKFENINEKEDFKKENIELIMEETKEDSITICETNFESTNDIIDTALEIIKNFKNKENIENIENIIEL